MSYEVREWVWDHSVSKGTARMVLVLIADRVADRRCIAYASVPTLMRRTNASRSAVRDALVKLVASGELEQLADRRGPRGETVYHLPAAAAHLAEQHTRQDAAADAPDGTARNTGLPPGGGPDSGPREHNPARPESSPGGQVPTPRGAGFRPGGEPDSGPQNPSEPKLYGTERSAAERTTAAEWAVDAATHAWAEKEGHVARLGAHGLSAADGKWRAHRATWAPRSAAAWAADWRAWIARERSPGTGRPNLYALPGGGRAPAAGMTRAQAHTAALLAALDEPTGTE